ncbi:hypothetical protein BH18THE2_BH18THE2_30350 [soil metagenome]
MTDSDETKIIPKNNSAIHKRKILLGTMVAAVAAVLIGGTTSFQSSLAENDDNDDNSPTDGYDIHATVIRHDSEHLNAEIDHFCKLDKRIVAVCQLYEGDDKDAQLVQVEFIITDQQYESIPDRDKQSWHNHAVELTPERGEPEFVSLPEGVEAGALLDTLKKTYGKVVTVWDPNDNLPDFPPYVFNVDSPFALGQDENDDLENEWETGDQ